MTHFVYQYHVHTGWALIAEHLSLQQAQDHLRLLAEKHQDVPYAIGKQGRKEFVEVLDERRRKLYGA